MVRLLENGRADLGVECARRLLCWSLDIAKDNSFQALAEAEATVERLEVYDRDLCSRPMYLLVGRLAINAAEPAEARDALTKLKKLNDAHIREPEWKSTTPERPSPGRILEWVEWARLTRLEGRMREASVLAKRALNASWGLDAPDGLDVRLQAFVAAHMQDIELSRGHDRVAEGLGELREYLLARAPLGKLSVFDPALWT